MGKEEENSVDRHDMRKNDPRGAKPKYSKKPAVAIFLLRGSISDKRMIQKAASREGVSANSWVINTVRQAMSGVAGE